MSQPRTDFSLVTELYSEARKHWPCAKPVSPTKPQSSATSIGSTAEHKDESLSITSTSQFPSASVASPSDVSSASSSSKSTSSRNAIRCILCQFDPKSDTVVVYQAYNNTIANYAVQNQTFAGCTAFSSTRMTWIKTNFLWMQYRCGWGTKDTNQERILAIWVKRTAFDDILRQSIESCKPNISSFVLCTNCHCSA